MLTKSTKQNREPELTIVKPHTEAKRGFPAFSYLVFTPQECKDYLDAVAKDGRRVPRPLSHRKIQAFANAMQAGRWRADSAEPVKFDVDGLLMDGFHRFNAIIRSGVSVMLCMAQQVPRDVEPVLDSGTVRTAAHSLWMMGYRYTTCLAVACRSVYLFERKLWKMESFVDNQLLIEVATRYENIQAYVGQCWNHTFIRSGSLVGCLFWIEQCNQELGSKFTEGILHGTKDGIGLASNDIAYMLREALIRDRFGKMHSFLGRNQTVATIFRCYERSLKGEVAARVKFSLDPVRYPWPEGGPYVEE